MVTALNNFACDDFILQWTIAPFMCMQLDHFIYITNDMEKVKHDIFNKVIYKATAPLN